MVDLPSTTLSLLNNLWSIFLNSEDHKLYNNLTVEQSSMNAINKYVENDLTDADIHDTPDGREGKSK